MALPSYFHRLKKLLQRRGNTQAEAEDLLQEAYLKMQEYCVKGGEIRRPEAFMARTVLRLALNARRDAHLELFDDREIDEFTSMVDPSPGPDEVLAADQCLEHMRRVLDTLSRRNREIFLMNRLDGLSFPQIAQQLGITKSAVEKHVARALVKLSKIPYLE